MLYLEEAGDRVREDEVKGGEGGGEDVKEDEELCVCVCVCGYVGGWVEEAGGACRRRRRRSCIGVDGWVGGWVGVYLEVLEEEVHGAEHQAAGHGHAQGAAGVQSMVVVVAFLHLSSSSFSAFLGLQHLADVPVFGGPGVADQGGRQEGREARPERPLGIHYCGWGGLGVVGGWMGLNMCHCILQGPWRGQGGRPGGTRAQRRHKEATRRRLAFVFSSSSSSSVAGWRGWAEWVGGWAWACLNKGAFCCFCLILL